MTVRQRTLGQNLTKWGSVVSFVIGGTVLTMITLGNGIHQGQNAPTRCYSEESFIGGL